jgi:hypothetical protein
MSLPLSLCAKDLDNIFGCWLSLAQLRMIHGKSLPADILLAVERASGALGELIAVLNLDDGGDVLCRQERARADLAALRTSGAG